MKPKIVTRLANIAAKLAGSDKYDSTVKPVTPLEYYMNEIPVTPKPTDRDAGKNLVVGDNGAYELQAIVTPVDVPEPTVADSGKFLGVDENGAYALGNVGGGSNDVEYVKITTSGTSPVVYHADKTYAEIEALIASGKKVYLQYTGDPLTSFKKAYEPNGQFYAINVFGINASTNKLTLGRINIDNTDNVTFQGYSISMS